MTIYDNLSSSSKSDICDLLDNVNFVKGDILDYQALVESSKKTNVVIHLAAKIGVAESIKNQDETMNVNVKGTENVLRSCVENKIKKIIFASSAAVYGKNNDMITEKSQTIPLSPYGESKLLAEGKIISFAEKNDMDAIILRIFNIYGKGQTKQYAGVITKFMEKISQNNSLEIYGDGSQTRDFVSINDVTESFQCILKNDHEKKNYTYNVGTGKSTSIKELAEIMIKNSGKKLEINYLDMKAGDIKHSVADTALAKKELGFVAKIRLVDELSKS